MMFRRKRLRYWTRDVQLEDGSWQRFEWRPVREAIDKHDGALTTYGTLRHEAAAVMRKIMDGPLPDADAPKEPCLFPLADGRRCAECATCQGYAA